MNKIVISLILGVTAGIIDVAPMVMKKMDRYSIVSAFIQWVVLGFIISHVELGVESWVKGLIVAVFLSLPIAVLVAESDMASVIPILVMSAILGSIVGFASGKMI